MIPSSATSIRALSRFVWLVLAVGIAACGEGAGLAESSGVDEVEVQRGPDMANENQFGPPVVSPLDISSTFGHRWKFSESRFDFHRGIDFFGERGDPILAIGTGTVTGFFPEGSAQYPNGGNTLIVRHDLAQPFQWQSRTIGRIYAVYLHLDSYLVAEDDTVNAGSKIATMGDSGSTTFVHLHFEIRAQTTCSLEFQVANPESSCAENGFDPHVHPYIFIGGENADQITISHQEGSPFRVTFDATRGDLDLNELRTGRGVINFNRRTGIDATSTESLDDFEYGWVTIVPEQFLSTSKTIRYEFEFPAKPDYVELTDIHGHGMRLLFSK
ncbi:MAG: M23 family metallopeptidase [SAR324 cluster bacterium]|nr:M23 family metallopeptidase [SAR324 cluster bacterium]